MNKACAVGVAATSACTAAEVKGEDEGEESNNKVVFFVWGKVANDGETFDRDDDDDDAANEVRDEEGEEGSSVDSGDDDMNIVGMEEEAADEDIEGETLGT